MSLRDAVNQKEIDAIIQSWLPAKLDDDKAQRLTADAVGEFAERNNMSAQRALAYLPESDAEGELDRWRKVVRDHSSNEAEPYANLLIKQLGLDLAKDSPDYGLLCQGIALASAELQGIRVSRSHGHWSDDLGVASPRQVNQLRARLPARVGIAWASP